MCILLGCAIKNVCKGNLRYSFEMLFILQMNYNNNANYDESKIEQEALWKFVLMYN